jgi:beta-phosphoglucomutase-like phosphatase (HAD superfamily)
MGQPPPAKGIIFDMDGVFANTEPLHFRAFQQVFKDCGVHLSDEYLYHLVGEPVLKNVQDIANDFSLHIDANEYQDRVEKEYHNILQNTHMDANRGIWDLIRRAQNLSYQIGLCTSSPRYQMDSLLNKIYDDNGIEPDVLGIFQAIVTLEDVQRKKPDPEPYLLVASRLQLEPGACLAIEDSVPGIISAKRAGCFSIALITDYNQHKDFSMADHTVHRLSDITIC